jgi:hypothetical protein
LQEYPATEVVVLVLAMAWTVPYLFDANRPATGILVVLDVFWPLSMAGYIVVDVMVAGARRWPPPLRYLPLVASLSMPVDILASQAPALVRNAATGIYFAVAYGLTGLSLIRQADQLSADSDARRVPTG